MALVLPLNGVSLRLDPGSVSLDDLLRALRADGGAPAAAWLAAAHHLLACGRERDFEAVLSEAAEREPTPGTPPAAVFPHVQALCSLAEFSAQQAAGERERRRRQELLMRATDLCHRAQRLSLEEQLPELVLGHVALVKVRCWQDVCRLLSAAWRQPTSAALQCCIAAVWMAWMACLRTRWSANSAHQPAAHCLAHHHAGRHGWRSQGL